MIDVELSVPSVTINPNLDDVQSAINACALQIIKCTQQIVAWQSIIVFDGDNKHSTKFSLDWSGGKSVYERAANDMEMVKTVIILTGSVQTLRNKVCTIVCGNLMLLFCILK